MSEDTLVSASAALDGFATAPDVIGFCYRTTDAPWFRWHDSEAHGPHGTVGIGGAFEVRAFDGERELRWHHHRDGLGRAVTVDDRRGGRLREYRRLLWGSVHADGPTPANWVRLFDPRIGPLWVPVTGSVENRRTVWLSVVEYTDTDRHGNVSVVDERLVGLVVDEPRKQTQP